MQLDDLAGLPDVTHMCALVSAGRSPINRLVLRFPLVSRVLVSRVGRAGFGLSGERFQTVVLIVTCAHLYERAPSQLPPAARSLPIPAYSRGNNNNNRAAPSRVARAVTSKRGFRVERSGKSRGSLAASFDSSQPFEVLALGIRRRDCYGFRERPATISATLECVGFDCKQVHVFPLHVCRR